MRLQLVTLNVPEVFDKTAEILLSTTIGDLPFYANQWPWVFFFLSLGELFKHVLDLRFLKLGEGFAK